MIFPVLLCGGSGTRLWPLSRKSYPKQFTDVVGDESLFQASARRFTGTGFADPLVVTGDPFRFIVTEQLDEIGLTPSGILIEPEGRNTAPAAAAATLFAMAQDPEAMILLVPSDHAVSQPDLFRTAVLTGKPAAEAGQIVTFGIAPSRAETGYGWLETGAEESARIWLGRKSAFGAMGQINDYMCLDGTIPVSQLPYVLKRIGEMSKEFGLDVANVFHAGDGNMHPLILFDANKPGDLELCEAFGAKILKLCVEVGGCLTGEHGVGIEKRDLMVDQYAPEDLEIQMAIKDVFDPKWLLNPAKVFPLQSSESHRIAAE